MTATDEIPCRYCGSESAGGICMDCVKHIRQGVCVWDPLRRKWRKPDETIARTAYRNGIKMIQWWHGGRLVSEKPAPDKK